MRIWGYVAIVAALVAAFGVTWAKAYDAGYGKRDQETQQEIIEAQVEAERQRDEVWAAAVKAAQEQIRTEEVIVEKIREVEVEIPTVVEKIVEVHPECRDLGPDYAGLLNHQVRAANSLQGPAAPAGVDDRVP